MTKRSALLMTALVAPSTALLIPSPASIYTTARASIRMALNLDIDSESAIATLKLSLIHISEPTRPY